MNDNVFLDTNILVYLYSKTESEKREACLSIFKQYSCTTSTQVLNEFCNVFIKKYGIPINRIKEFIASILKICRIKFINESTVYFALDLNNQYGYSYYDCLILASALESDCEVLFSEDMSDRQIIEGRLKITNPFKSQTNEQQLE